MAFVAKDPLGFTVSASDSVVGVGDHPYKHHVTEEDLYNTITDPNFIFGSKKYPEISSYIRYRSTVLSDFSKMQDNIVVAHVDYDDGGIKNEAHVVTSVYTDHIPVTVNQDDVRYAKK